MMNRDQILDIVMKGLHYYYDIKLTQISRKEYERISENPDSRTIIKQLIEDGINEEKEVQKYIRENLR